MSDFIEVYNVLNKGQCNWIIDLFKQDTRTHPGYTGSGVRPEHKRSTDLNADFNSEEYSQYNTIIGSAVLEAQKRYIEKYPIVATGPEWEIFPSYNVQGYKDGEGYFQEHFEYHYDFPNRMLVWSLFLNDAESGTYFVHYDKVIPAVAGSIIVFPAYWMHTHRGVVPNVGDKYIATGWWEYRAPISQSTIKELTESMQKFMMGGGTLDDLRVS